MTFDQLPKREQDNRIESFSSQYVRMILVFGERAMNKEFRKLAWEEVKNMDTRAVRKVVDVWCGERLPHQAPRIKDFREEFNKWEKREARLESENAWKKGFKQHQKNEKLPLYGANNVIDLMEKVKAGKINLGDHVERRADQTCPEAGTEKES